MTRFLTLIAVAFATITLTLTAAALMSNEAQAAIPHSKTIVIRLAKNSGRGVYVVEQEVRFAGPEGIVLKERWLVQNSDVMRLVVQSPKSSGDIKVADFRWDALYNNGRRTATTPAASIVPGANEPGKIVEPAAKTTTIDRSFSAPGNKNDVFDSGTNRFFDDVKKNGAVHDGKHFFWNGFGCG